MLNTDIKRTVDGITANCSFKDYNALYDFMVRENIDCCKVSASVASVQMTDSVEVSKADVEKILKGGM